MICLRRMARSGDNGGARGSSHSWPASGTACGQDRALPGSRHPPQRRGDAASRSWHAPRTVSAGAASSRARAGCRATPYGRDPGSQGWSPDRAGSWAVRSGRVLAVDRSWGAATTSFSSMIVAGTADVGVQDRRIVRGVWRRSGLEPMLEDGGDALVGERTDLDRAGGDRLRSGGINAPIETQDAKACTEPLLRMWPSSQDGDDQRLGVGADRPRLALEALRAPLGIEPVRARHVVGQGAVPWAAIASGVRGNALTAMEHFHRAFGQPCLDLLADQGVWDGVKEPGDFDVIVDSDPGKRPFSKLV